MRILGIDPGLSGALAVLDFVDFDSTLVSVIDVPTVNEKAKRRVWIAPLTEWIMELDPAPSFAFIERAQAMPEQGASSGFIYGRAVGYLESAVLCAGMRLRTAEPASWKRKLGLIGKDKAESQALAQKLVKNIGDSLTRKKDHNRAEAMLIAIYGAGQLRQQHARDLARKRALSL